ncbi:DUF3570 domain-containing protein [Mucilaginibacter sp. BJC16-A38]|uniref:DUF3570 domain-containing protein n=1 Tax=Mucilaginibacter phenanthrenivorans TaxID=1234842 RepID=UPI00215770FC|nr:DUF3570 domain-containing protein [Mucilaginibacter phenanthrenivorans]MCR8561117.1 DUF3570 domain-containing protein [Mucilaginibacter phenanthrenivorans]
MKKVYLSVFGFALICRFGAHAQTKQDTTKNKKPFSLYQPVVTDPPATDYNPRALRIDEINLVSSYYGQNGNHSAITGGIGTEKVTDISNGLDMKLVWVGDNENKNTISLGIGYDHHTSASSAFVTTTGLGKQGGTRIYPSFDWTVENPKTGNTFGLGAYYSGEYNYKSLGGDLHFSQKTADKNGEFSVKLQAYMDHVTMIYPSEFITQITPVSTGATYVTTASGNVVLSNGGSSESKPSLPTKPRNTYTASFGYSQIINSRFQVMFLADVVAQNGYLSLPFHRVYFTNQKDTIEKLPSSRFKLPLGIRANYFLGDNIILRSYYRYYADNWGSHANTANLEVTYKLTPFFSISPFYRFYSQSAAKYFAPYAEHSANDEYYTSNYEYAKFNSQFFGAGFRLAPPKGVFGWQNLHELEIRYGHYTQTTGLSSDVISLNLGFK